MLTPELMEIDEKDKQTKKHLKLLNLED
jgi:hypothetical protein